MTPGPGTTKKNRGTSHSGVTRRRKYGTTRMEHHGNRGLQKLNADQIKQIDTALGRFFFGCNISFNVLQSKLFKDFIACLIPPEIYKPPTRKTLATTILDRVHQDIVTERVSVNGTQGVLLIDGWKNSSSNKQNVVCTLHSVGSKSLFLNSWDMTGISETGEELIRIVDEAKALAQEKFNIKVYAVVSDNAANMVKMGNNVDIWHTTCNSHSGNLLAKGLVPKEFAQEVNKVLREFKSPGIEKEIIKNGGSRIILACDTRWCSYRDTFRCLLKNFGIIKKLIDDKKITIKDENKKVWEQPLFDAKLQDYILIFDPICKLINVCQKSNCSIADACQEWLNLEISTDNEAYEEVVGLRLNKVLTPIVLAANLLHPRYKGRNFKDTNHHDLAREFLEQELTAEDSINNHKLTTLTTLIGDLNTYKTGKDFDFKKIKLMMKEALDADCAGSKTKSIGLYEEAVKFTLNVMAVTNNSQKKKYLEELKEKVEERITALHVIVDGLELNDYLNNVGIFKKLNDQGFQSPAAFWGVAEISFPKLSSLALKLLRIPAASAQLERLFSFWAFIHSDIRNRLTAERSMKLVDIYYSLKMNELHDDHYDDFVEDEKFI